MGIYQRGSALYFDFEDAQGKRRQISSGFKVGREAEAQKALDKVLKAVAAEKELAASLSQEQAEVVVPAKGATVGMYARHWLKERVKYKPQAAKEDRWKLERHILPALEHRTLAEFGARHGRGFVQELRAAKNEDGKPRHAPRTVRSIWSCLHNMMDDATADGFFQSNPCVLKDGDLPPVEDKDPRWRKTAIFSRAERDQLISDERIPLFRRVRNGILFLAGLRPSEAFALRLFHYDRTTEHLGQLDLMCAFNTALRAEKELKVAAKRRLVPVHPALAKLLAEWLLSGWEAYVGRKPTSEDLLIPNPKGGHTRVDDAYDDMLGDQAMLGWRKRRLYDSRRTFISLARADKFDKDLLKWVTHGPEAGKILDLYTEFPWEEACVEMLKMKVGPQATGRIVELRRTADGAVCDSLCDSGHDHTGNISESLGRRRESNPRPTDYKGVLAGGTPRTITANGPAFAGLQVLPPPLPTPRDWPPVTLSQTDRLTVAAKLEAAKVEWLRAEDTTALRRRLIALLESLGGAS